MSLTGFISYKRVGWTGQTPWNPTNLNIMDKGIKDNNDMIANLRSEVSALNSNIAFYNCFMKNFISESDCYGYGYNYIIYNKMQKVGMCKFTSKIENTSTDITDFKFQYNIKDVFTKAGLTSDSIKILGGTWQCYNTDGKIINKLIGYGTCIRQSSGIIRLERYYTTDGKIGAWAASEFVKGCYIYGEFLFSL